MQLVYLMISLTVMELNTNMIGVISRTEDRITHPQKDT